MKKHMMLGCLVLSMCLSGCLSTLKANVESGKSFNDLGTIYVAHFAPDERNLNETIASELGRLGYPATSGELKDMPSNTNTLVTYIDNWMWDMTNYMIKINIKFKDATTNEVIVSGESYRSSAVRKDPEFMIRETLQEILKKKSS